MTDQAVLDAAEVQRAVAVLPGRSKRPRLGTVCDACGLIVRGAGADGLPHRCECGAEFESNGRPVIEVDPSKWVVPKGDCSLSSREGIEVTKRGASKTATGPSETTVIGKPDQQPAKAVAPVEGLDAMRAERTRHGNMISGVKTMLKKFDPDHPPKDPEEKARFNELEARLDSLTARRDELSMLIRADIGDVWPRAKAPAKEADGPAPEITKPTGPQPGTPIWAPWAKAGWKAGKLLSIDNGKAIVTFGKDKKRFARDTDLVLARDPDAKGADKPAPRAD